MPDDINQPARDVFEAARTRRSIRAYKPDPVPMALLREIVALGRHAPSGTNIQPWRVHVLRGAALARVGAAIQRAFLDEEPGHKRDYDYYTDPIYEPYLARRRQCGWGLYGTLGIGREDKDRMHAQHARNFTFFDAPVGLIFSIDRELEKGSWLDYGMFLQSIMVAARPFGLETCPQAAWLIFWDVLQRRLRIPPEQTIVCGMALGYPDPDEKVNEFTPERMPVSEFVTFVERLDE